MAKTQIIISPRDECLLRLLSRTPVTKQLVLKASHTFPEPFTDERRVRERMQAMADGGLVRIFNASAVGGLLNYYKLTPEGFRHVHNNADENMPGRSFFAEISPSSFQHTLTVAEVIVQVMVASHEHGISIERFHRENELILEAASQSLSPDCHFQLKHGERVFQLLFEIDNSTESIDSFSHQSIKNKVLGYDTYQDGILTTWAKSGRSGTRPAFRVVFLTKSQERAEHILSLAHELANNRDRRLIVAGLQSDFLTERDALRAPIFLDHFGKWQSLVNPHATATFIKTPVRLRRAIAPQAFV